MTEPVIVIKVVNRQTLAVACTFESIDEALRALDAARKKIAAGEVPMKPKHGIEVVEKMPEELGHG